MILRRRTLRHTVAAVAALTLLASTVPVAPAVAVDDYPSWADVEASRTTETAKRGEIDKITILIQGLDAELQTARDLATRRSAEFDTAQSSLDATALKATTLATQAEAARSEADASTLKIGRLAATLAKGGGSGAEMSLQVFLSGEESDGLLSRLGSLSKLSDTIERLYATAATDRNAAAALSDQAQVALAEREKLAEVAQLAFNQAAEANAAAEVKVAEQQQVSETLQAQLAVLVEDRAAIESDFERGQVAAATAAAAAAAATASGGPSMDAGQLSGQGWARPVPGRITDDFGPRPAQPVAGVNPFHYAVDLSAGCSTPIYAASSGRVSYAGWMGSYGNWLQVDHGSGVQTGYAHTSQILVKNGDSVQAGQVVALAGTTGASTGCHLHYEVRVNGARIDPEPFMGARGAPIG